MTILVTGATGFIGRHFLHYLTQDKLNVRALIRSSHSAPRFNSNIDIFYADLTQPETLIGVCEGIQTVLHLGGYAHSWGKKDEFAQKHHQVNYLGTQNMLSEAVRAKVSQFIYFSSVKAVADSKYCINEEWNKLPNTPYGIAKREAEKLVLSSARDNNMHATILRPALVFGPGWKGNLASMLRAIDKGLFLPLPKTNNARSMISVYDLYRAAMLAAANPSANGKIYFVTDKIPYSTYQLYTLILNALDKPVPKWHIPMHIFKLLASLGDIAEKILSKKLPFNTDTLDKLFGSAHYSSNQIENDLNYKPIYDLEKMLPEIVAEYRKSM